MNECTNPSAVNYNPSATVDDGSCVYLEKYNGTCYAFQDVDADQLVDRSFTLSFSLKGKDWVMFHDYVPDFYFSDREHLYSLKDRKVYKHNQGAPGVYYEPTPYPFFIDVIFSAEREFILNSLQWVSEVISSTGEQEFQTLTHITIWDSQQCTGRLALSQVWENLSYGTRKLQGQWNFDDFRDMVAHTGTAFLKDLFSNFQVDPAKLDTEKPWFDQDLLHDNWFCIRLEFDNTTGNTIYLHGADINAQPSPR